MIIQNAASLITALSAIGAVLMSWRNSKKIQSVHVDINSRMEQLLTLTRSSSHAEGRKEAEAEAIKRNP